ncbi:hypothetical protein M427DRAFT_59173 [Gonapodya prolifera JEL478]|uniref:Sphingolipid delta4-desaturase N-terminal domain-containing protein n=1 Tax=Gonapodya prolifera (strain JEL478) TaxID=1344416 RepID=A0A139A7S3_GONPJ|nr:hypothetical protein M427DRAFT_59173 [Gonapodya prolifera JEL478]|eukprot:KXS12861.1 hypothetical protein M427DRAFT_59173 [Gonapodya prolifera JEL478]
MPSLKNTGARQRTSGRGEKDRDATEKASDSHHNGVAPSAEGNQTNDDGPLCEKPLQIGEDGRLRDFIWVGYAEPHATRRTAMLKKYPEIKSLMRPDPITGLYVVVLVALQLFVARYVAITPGFLWSWRFWAVTYAVGGTASASLVLAVHEVTHFLALKSPLHNKILALVANIPIVFPFCVEFKKYHMDHHRFQGVDGVDGDVPTAIEARLLDSYPGKLFFLTFQIIFYALRPLIVATPVAYRTPVAWYLSSLVFQLSVMAAIVRTWGWASILYLLLSVFLGASLHPMAGHFVAEHFVTDQEGLAETYSYYGPLNAFAFNVGYHVEHHDFPSIPWSQLPKLRKIAPEFYEPLPKVSSWPGFMLRFFLDRSVGLRSRVKRVNRGGQLGWKGTAQGTPVPEELPTQ